MTAVFCHVDANHIVLQCMAVWHIPENFLEADLDFKTPCSSGRNI